MPASHSPVDIQYQHHQLFPAFNPDLSHCAADAEPQHLQQQFRPTPSPNEHLHDTIFASYSLTETARFGDLRFPFQPVQEAASMGTLSASPFEDNAPAADIFATSQALSVSPMPERQDSVTSITVKTSAFGATEGERRVSIGEVSDDGSPDSDHHGGNSLEEPMADEFGLSTQGPGDGTDLGGRAKDDKGDAPPPWSELKTKAGKERKRLPLACIACRRKKIRCSGEKPACKHCLRSRIPCVYKVTTRKAAPRTDYMAMLDKRLKRMEERIIKIVPKVEQDSVVSSVARAIVKPAMPGTVAGLKSTSKKRGADEAFGPDLDHWARAPARSNLDGVDRPTSLMAQEAEEGKLLLEGGDALPSREIQEHLAEVFFETIYGQAYHILHKPSYMRKLRAGTLPPVLILSVCAIATRFSTHPKLASSPNFLRGEEWATHAREIVTRRYEWPNITILTCLLILGLHEFGTCHGGRSWALGGQAIRMAFALQLHKDLEYDPLRRNGKEAQLSFIDREIRRRTMWACFLMDRFNSSGTDRPTFIKEETVKIPLPIKEKYFQLDMPGPTETLQGEVLNPATREDGQLVDAKENMGVAAYMIRAIALWGRIINYLNQGGKELDPYPMWSPDSEYSRLIKQTEEMSAHLPESLSYTLENLHQHDTENMANQFLFLHISIQQNILFMNRFAVSSPSGHSLDDVPKPFVTKAGAKAFAAANRISELLRDAEPYLIAAPFVGYCAFLSSTVHIFGVFSGNPAMEAASKKNLATNVKFLSKMKRYWGMFHWMSENLREQYRTCADAARQGAPAKESSTSPIFQYGDWFDRYPHGVSQTDFLDPAMYKKAEKGDDAVLEQKPELHTVEEFFTTLSPQSAEGAAASGRQAQGKRKSVTRKSGSASSRADQQHLGRLQTEFIANIGGADQAGRTVQNQRALSASLGQTSSATGFNPRTIPNSQTSGSYHTLSPVSPAAMGQFGHHHPPATFFPPHPFSLHLPHHANGLGLPQLDRQLVFGAYGGIEPGQSIGSVAGWPAEATEDAGPADAQNGAQAQAAAAAAFGAEASSAWFMPFNMEPPEIGHDLTLGGVGILDGFAGMFGGSGMATPNAGMGGMHHGRRG